MEQNKIRENVECIVSVNGSVFFRQIEELKKSGRHTSLTFERKNNIILQHAIHHVKTGTR